jgi:crotonobetainyl-CoA:carnitine CoA-transferase CaiB-like acyl-CoA transferase
MEHEAFQAIDFIQEVSRREGVSLRTTRCPIRIDGEIYKSPIGAPSLGQHTEAILAEFLK